MEIKELIVEKVKEKFGSSIEDVLDFRNDLCITITKDKIVELAQFLKENTDLQFDMCKDVTAIDWATRKKRFRKQELEIFKIKF